MFKKMNKEYKLFTNSESSLQNKKGFCIQKWSDGSYLKGRYRDNKLYGFAKIRSTDGRFLNGKN
jgi:hypothetical protein